MFGLACPLGFLDNLGSFTMLMAFCAHVDMNLLERSPTDAFLYNFFLYFFNNKSIGLHKVVRLCMGADACPMLECQGSW